MRRFISLVKKEWHMHKAWPILYLTVGIIFIGLLPMFEHRFNNSMTEEEVRGGFMIFGLLLTGFAIPVQFLLSIRRDIKSKELWLHNSGAITMLIGAKVAYTMAWVMTVSLFYTCTFHFSNQLVEGTGGEIIFLQLIVASIVFVFCILMPVVALPFYALHLQLKRYTSYGSVIITGATFGVFLFVVEKISSSSLYARLMQQGEVSLEPVGTMLPSFNSNSFRLDIGSLYIVEELVMWALLAACFIAASKWIERVVTR